jgi:MFS family permease
MVDWSLGCRPDHRWSRAGHPFRDQATLKTLLVRDGAFLRFWAGSSISTVGNQVTILALPWLVLQLTQSPFQLGIVGALEFVPFLLFGLIVGVYADRWDRRKILLVADLVRFAALASVPLAAFFDVLTLAQLYLVAFIAGTARVWFEVAHYSMIPALVSPARAVEANSSLEVTEGVSSLVGPALGGLLIKVFGAANALLADSLSFLLAAAAWFSLPARPSEPLAEVGWRAQLVAGLHLVRHHRVILENTLSGLVLNIVFAAVTTVYVFYAQHELHFDAARTGLALGLAGIGPIAVATSAPALRRRFRLGQLLLAELFVVGPLLALLDVAPLVPAVPALLLVALSFGLASGAAILGRIVFRSYIQAAVPPQLLGRVNASIRVVAWGGVPVGAVLGGTLTQLVGVRWLIALASAATLLLFLGFALASETKRI